MKGRKKTPLHLVELRGNPGKRPVNKAEPRAPSGNPRCPSYLSARAKYEHKAICQALGEMGILGKSDWGMITAAALALADVAEYREMIAKYGKAAVYRERGKPNKCPVCNGSGRWGENSCHGCQGHGWVAVEGRVIQERHWWVFEEHKAWEHFIRAAACLGLDPTSRARLSSKDHKEAGSWTDLANS
jgi:P27 family predicted phage terminase small subunit